VHRHGATAYQTWSGMGGILNVVPPGSTPSEAAVPDYTVSTKNIVAQLVDTDPSLVRSASTPKIENHTNSTAAPQMNQTEPEL